MDTRIDEYLDGELDEEAVERLLNDVERDEALRSDLEQSIALRDAFRSLPPQLCPPEIAARAKAAVRSSRTDRAPRRSIRRGVAASMAGFCAIVVLFIALDPLAKEPEPQPTHAEVQQALDDVQLAFALVADAGRKTGRAVREDVMLATTAEAVRRAFPEENQISQ